MGVGFGQKVVHDGHQAGRLNGSLGDLYLFSRDSAQKVGEVWQEVHKFVKRGLRDGAGMTCFFREARYLFRKD